MTLAITNRDELEEVLERNGLILQLAQRVLYQGVNAFMPRRWRVINQYGKAVAILTETQTRHRWTIKIR